MRVSTRKSGSKEDQEARDLVVRWMMEDGLTVQNDEHGNIIGRLDGEGPPIVTGSHIDTVSTAVSTMVCWVFSLVWRKQGP